MPSSCRSAVGCRGSSDASAAARCASLCSPVARSRARREYLSRGIKIDYVGFVLSALWLGSLEIVLDKGQREDWFQSDFINSFTAISLVSAMIFFPWELTRKEPIVDVRLLFKRQFG